MNKKTQEMDYKLLLDTAVLAGELMLKNGAEIFRVEGTIRHILGVSGLKTTQAYATLTGIMVTLDDPTIDSLTVVRRIDYRSTSLEKVHRVNDISRKLCEGQLSLKEAFHLLKHFDTKRTSEGILVISYIACAGAFAILFGGGIWETLFAGINGLLLYLILSVLTKIKLNQFMKLFLASMFMAILTMICTRIQGVHFNSNMVIVSGIMPIVPGASITNAIRDTLQGDYTAGGARGIEAIVTAVAIALGVGFGLMFTGGSF